MTNLPGALGANFSTGSTFTAANENTVEAAVNTLITALTNTGLLKSTGTAVTAATSGADFMRPHWVNVLDHGADPTGVADSTTAFTAAVAALPSTGGWVYAPTGLYKISSTVTFNQFQGLRGDGKNVTILKYTGTGPCIKGTNGTVGTLVTPVAFEGFTVDGTSAGVGAIGLQIGSSAGGNLMHSYGHDVCIQHFSSAGAVGIYFTTNGSPVVPACEKNNFTGISLYQNTTGALFDGANVAFGSSFAYSVFEFFIISNANQCGVTIQNGALLDSCKMSIFGNFNTGAGGNTGYVLGIDSGNTSGYSALLNSNVFVSVELDGSDVPHTTIVMGGNTTSCQFVGDGLLVFSPTFQGAAITSGSLFRFSGYISDPVLGTYTSAYNIPLSAVSTSAYSTTVSANTLAQRDAQGSLTALNHIPGHLSVATSSTTLALGVGTAAVIILTGTTQNQVVTLPPGANIGQSWKIINATSSATVTCNGYSSGTAATLTAGQSAVFTALSATPTTAANWNVK